MADRTASARYMTNRAARLFARSMEHRLKAVGVLPSQLPIFLALADGKALSQKALVEVAAVEQPSMGMNLARMERHGLIERSPDPSDRRGIVIRLTPAALAKVTAVRKVVNEGTSEALADFKEDEKALYLAMLQRIINNISRSFE